MVRLFYFIVCFPFFTYAQLTLDPLFSDHMLFQRDKPIVIFGKGTPGERVRIMLGSEWMETSVQDDSTWHGRFPPRIASSIPVSIRILGEKDSFLLHDILVGDVWLCIGQSNMEWPMQKEMFFSLEKGTADQPAIRFMNPTYAGKDVYGLPFSDSIIQNLQHTKFFSGKWQISDSVTFQSMSAVAYYFGKQLYDSTGIPIGLINYSIGGAPLETFIDRNALKTHPRFAAKVKGDWLNNEHLPVWIRERGRQNVGAVEVPSDENGKYHAFKPGVAYESGIKSLHLFPIKGMICYQGESNAQEEERVMEYGELTAFMVNDFRRKWKEPTLPFYFVQLSSIDTVTYKGHLWGPFRNEQRLLLEKLPNSGMAVSSDVGSRLDVHPRNKKDIGKRLARWALKDLYNKQVVPSGPLPLQATYQSGKILIIFKYAEEGLFSSDGGVIRGFSFNGSEEVDVRIRGSAIEIDSPIRPQFVYYGWKPYSNGNLVNAQRLPASTFKIRVLVP